MSITKYEVFSIDPSLAGNKEHQKIYKELATDMWGASSVGHGDLLEGLM